MVNYKNGKIYKIVSDNTDKIYIGSTTQKYLSTRLSTHVSHFKDANRKQSEKCLSHKILEAGNYRIILIESYPCESKDELRAREQYHIELNKDHVVNNQRAHLSNTKDITVSCKDDEKEYNRQRYANNKNSFSQAARAYYQKNKEACKARSSKLWHCDICDKGFKGHRARHLALHAK